MERIVKNQDGEFLLQTQKENGLFEGGEVLNAVAHMEYAVVIMDGNASFKLYALDDDNFVEETQEPCFACMGKISFLIAFKKQSSPEVEIVTIIFRDGVGNVTVEEYMSDDIPFDKDKTFITHLKEFERISLLEKEEDASCKKDEPITIGCPYIGEDHFIDDEDDELDGDIFDDDDDDDLDDDDLDDDVDEIDEIEDVEEEGDPYYSRMKEVEEYNEAIIDGDVITLFWEERDERRYYTTYEILAEVKDEFNHFYLCKEDWECVLIVKEKPNKKGHYVELDGIIYRLVSTIDDDFFENGGKFSFVFAYPFVNDRGEEKSIVCYFDGMFYHISEVLTSNVKNNGEDEVRVDDTIFRIENKKIIVIDGDCLYDNE